MIDGEDVGWLGRWVGRETRGEEDDDDVDNRFAEEEEEIFICGGVLKVERSKNRKGIFLACKGDVGRKAEKEGGKKWECVKNWGPNWSGSGRGGRKGGENCTFGYDGLRNCTRGKKCWKKGELTHFPNPGATRWYFFRLSKWNDFC